MLKFRLIPAEQRPTTMNTNPPITAAPVATGRAEQGSDNERPTLAEPDYAALQAQTDTVTANDSADTSATAADSSENGLDSKIPELLEFFPKSLRNRTRILLLSIKDHVKLGENNRVIYKNTDGSENQGSSLIALVHYLVSPLPPSKKQTRPFDLLDFAKILQKTATPSNAYGNGKKDIIEALLNGEQKQDAGTRREDSKIKKPDRNGWMYIYSKGVN